MKPKVKLLLLFILAFLLLVSFTMIPECADGWFSKKKVVRYEVKEVAPPDLTIKQGLLCNTKQTVKVKRGNKTIAVVKLGEPIMVAQADKPEKWGFFQFPGIQSILSRR